MINNAIFVLF